MQRSLAKASHGIAFRRLVYIYMGVDSITALNLSAIVPRILNKKEAFISNDFYVSTVAVYLYFMSIS